MDNMGYLRPKDWQWVNAEHFGWQATSWFASSVGCPVVAWTLGTCFNILFSRGVSKGFPTRRSTWGPVFLKGGFWRVDWTFQKSFVRKIRTDWANPRSLWSCSAAYQGTPSWQCRQPVFTFHCMVQSKRWRSSLQKHLLQGIPGWLVRVHAISQKKHPQHVQNMHGAPITDSLSRGYFVAKIAHGLCSHFQFWFSPQLLGLLRKICLKSIKGLHYSRQRMWRLATTLHTAVSWSWNILDASWVQPG